MLYVVADLVRQKLLQMLPFFYLFCHFFALVDLKLDLLIIESQTVRTNKGACSKPTSNLVCSSKSITKRCWILVLFMYNRMVANLRFITPMVNILKYCH